MLEMIPAPLYYTLGILIGFLVFIILFRKAISKKIEEIKIFSFKKGDLDTKVECEKVKTTDISQEIAASDKELLKEGKKEEKETKEEPKTVEDARMALYYAVFLGDFPDDKKMAETYLKLQELEKNPTEKLKNEAHYYALRYDYLNDHAAFQQLKKMLDHYEIESLVNDLIGSSLKKANLFEKAIEEYELSFSSAKSDLDKTKAVIDITKCLYKLGKKPESFMRLGEALDEFSNPDAKAVLYEALAELYERENNNEFRAIALIKASEFKPNNEDILFGIGYSFSEADLDEISLFHYYNAERINPSRGGLLNNMGVEYERLKMPMKSVETYKKAVDLKETLSAANLAYRYMNAGLEKEASDILDSAKAEKNPHPNVGSAIADLAKKKEEEKKISQELEEIAIKQRQFFVAFADCYFIIKKDLPDLNGQWKDGDTTAKSESADKMITIELAKGKKKMKIIGKITNRAAKVESYNEQRYLRYPTESSDPVEYSDYSDKKGYLYFDDIKKEINIMLLSKDSKNLEFIKLQKNKDS